MIFNIMPKGPGLGVSGLLLSHINLLSARRLPQCRHPLRAAAGGWFGGFGAGNAVAVVYDCGVAAVAAWRGRGAAAKGIQKQQVQQPNQQRFANRRPQVEPKRQAAKQGGIKQIAPNRL